jgi:hypothetical protein
VAELVRDHLDVRACRQGESRPLLFNANATSVRDRIKALVGAADPTPHVVVLDAGTDDSLDVTSAEILDELVDTLRSAGIALWLADLRGPVLDRARRTGLLRTVGEDQVFRTVEEAIDAVQDRQREREPASGRDGRVGDRDRRAEEGRQRSSPASSYQPSRAAESPCGDAISRTGSKSRRVSR